MAANTSPIFPVAPVVTAVSMASPTAVGNWGQVAQAGINAAYYFQMTQPTTNGLRIDAVTVTAMGSTNAGAVNLYISDGTTLRYFTSIDISAVTASTTVDPFTATKQFSNLVLPPGYTLWAAATVTQSINLFTFGGSY